MNNEKKRMVRILLFTALVLIVAVIGWLLLTHFVGGGNPEKSLSENEKEFLLTYLDQFKEETVIVGQSEAEITRIVKKNELLEEYRTCLEAMAGNTLTETEYSEHYEQLMSIANKLLLLEPDKSEEQEFELLLRQLLLKLKDEQYYCEVYGSTYVSGCNIDVTSLEQSITEIEALLENYVREKITTEEAKNTYIECFGLIEKGSPRIYNLLSSP